MIINFEDNSKYLWWQWSLNLWSKIYNVSLDQYTNKSFIWCVEKKNEFQFKIFNIPRLCACTFLLGSVHQVFHNISFYIHVYKHFITNPMWWKKNIQARLEIWFNYISHVVDYSNTLSNLMKFQTDKVIWSCVRFSYTWLLVLVIQFQFFPNKKILLSLFTSFTLEIYPSFDVKPQEVNLMHIQLIKLKSAFGFFVYYQYF